MQIPIPKYFSLYNDIMREDMEEKGWTVSFSYYDALAEQFGKAKDCIECGQCKAKCPFGLDTPNLLKRNYEDYKTFLS